MYLVAVVDQHGLDFVVVVAVVVVVVVVGLEGVGCRNTFFLICHF